MRWPGRWPRGRPEQKAELHRGARDRRFTVLVAVCGSCRWLVTQQCSQVPTCSPTSASFRSTAAVCQGGERLSAFRRGCRSTAGVERRHPVFCCHPPSGAEQLQRVGTTSRRRMEAASARRRSEARSRLLGCKRPAGSEVSSRTPTDGHGGTHAGRLHSESAPAPNARSARPFGDGTIGFCR
jgi:hypothetical protein